MLFRFILPKPFKVKFSRAVMATMNYCTAKNEIPEELNKPISYTKSAANAWQAKHTRMGADFDDLWYKPYVVYASLTIFMIYFCILREENDIDQELDKTLYSRVEGLEEAQLRISLKYYRENRLNTKEIEERLRVVEERKQT